MLEVLGGSKVIHTYSCGLHKGAKNRCIKCKIYVSLSTRRLPSPRQPLTWSQPVVYIERLRLTPIIMSSLTSRDFARHDVDLASRPQHSFQNTALSDALAGQQAVKQSSLFSKFSELPFELRTQIWQYAAAQPRLVEVHEVEVEVTFKGPPHRDDPQDHALLGGWPRKETLTHYRSKTLDPFLLSTCHESRKVALPVHKKTLRIRILKGAVYLDYKHDTISMHIFPEMLGWRYTTTFSDFYGFRHRIVNSLRSVAFDARHFLEIHDGSPSEDQITSTVRTFHRGYLKEMLLVLNDDGTSIRWPL